MTIINSSSQNQLLRGTNYGDNGVDAYAKFAHGSDLGLFLNVFVANDLDQLNQQEGKKLLDAGCGAAPWSIYAAKKGAIVNAIDLQPGMIKNAKEAIEQAGPLSGRIVSEVGDATDLSFEDKMFDHAISINVGCNLPTSIFSKHFEEIGRVLKKDGTATIALPYSLDVVFTDGSKEANEVQARITKVLSGLPSNPKDQEIQNKLGELEEIVSATFAVIGNRLVLVDDINRLESGQKIWRKLTKVTIPNHYHSQDEYIKAFEKGNLKIVEISQRTLRSSEERDMINALDIHPKLGEEYERHPPFLVYHLTKKLNINENN
ncbi:MAG TPA: class I SAM-dependent methyltransferase [Rhabdochlamydiaceae bacterium]|nr:class I SAM-dependent methyltransferase [Rhabdochlamydiaceae bacterium]